MVKIDYKDDIAFVNLPESSTSEDIVNAMGLLFSNLDYKDKPFSLWKIHETELNVSPYDLRRVKEYVTKNRGSIPFGRAAVVVKSKEQRGIILIYELISYKLPVDLRIFENYDEAVAWLESELQK